ncbi:MAG TPA: GvpL/GvpF family gas vesicle protein [Gaiellaceae bacterium]|nr:GvpL/GvpF family gas vesicle protein [Gaiellaceae bacterium]
MSRFYLYGITRPREVPERLREEGIFLLECEGRAAVVSELDEGPVEATRRNLLAHADVVEQLHEESVVLPARFGYMLESEEEVLELLALPEIEQLLERHKGTCELTLKGTYEESVLAEVGAALEPLREAYRAAPSVEAGIALGEAVGEGLADRRAHDQALVLGELRPLALEVLTSEPAGEFGAFNAALLVERSGVAAVEKQLEQLAARMSPPLHFKLVGPLPPYSFVRLQMPAVA